MAMQLTKKEEKIEKLCSGFSLLGKKDQEDYFGILHALLYVKLKADFASKNPIKRKGKYGYGS